MCSGEALLRVGIELLLSTTSVMVMENVYSDWGALGFSLRGDEQPSTSILYLRDRSGTPFSVPSFLADALERRMSGILSRAPQCAAA